MKKPHYLPLLSLAFVFLPAWTAAAPTRSVEDLKTAYKGETTAHSKYLAYAAKADAEGYAYVATLFRAASQAESIHARNHKRALAELGVRHPVPGKYTGTPGTTAENLKDAIKGETYEKDTMYPKMIADAEAENAGGALQSFRYALAAEKQHAALYTAALTSLSSRPQNAVFYVCTVCGATFKDTAPAVCPVCGTPREKFLVIRKRA
ncbi:MAG: rubrerythrin family protein [Chthonomonadales bacterium]